LPLGREALLNDVDLRRVAGVGIVARSDQAIQASELPLFCLDLGHVLDDRIRSFADRLIEQVHQLELRRLPLLKKLRALAKVQPVFQRTAFDGSRAEWLFQRLRSEQRLALSEDPVEFGSDLFD